MFPGFPLVAEDWLVVGDLMVVVCKDVGGNSLAIVTLVVVVLVTGPMVVKFAPFSFVEFPLHSGRPLSSGKVQMLPFIVENTVPKEHSNVKRVRGSPNPQSTHL